MYKLIALNIALLLVSSPAVAADVDNSFAPSEGFSWTGLYLGGSIGWAKTVDDDAAFPIAPPVTIQLHSEGTDDNLGFHIGYNYQMGNFVVGAEYEYTELNLQFVGDGLGPLPIFIEDSHQLKARFGYAFGNILPYATVGQTHAAPNIGPKDWTNMIGIGLDVAIKDNILLGVAYDKSWYDTFDGLPIEGTLDKYSLRLGYKF